MGVGKWEPFWGQKVGIFWSFWMFLVHFSCLNTFFLEFLVMIFDVDVAGDGCGCFFKHHFESSFHLGDLYWEDDIRANFFSFVRSSWTKRGI